LAWSLDSRQIAYRAEEMVAGKRYFAIRVVSVDDRSTVELAGLERFLGTPRWTPDGCVIFQANREGSLRQVRVVSGIDSEPAQRVAHLVAIASPELEIWVCDAESEHRAVVSSPGERCFDPILSPAGDRVCYSVLSGGGSIAVASVVGGENINLGYGSNPSWAPDGRHLAYEVTEDDGLIITASDLYIVAADGAQRIRLTDTPDVIERWPSWSTDGERIAFSAGGAIYVMPSPMSPTTGE
jgi:Tol biopolymer transport system component